MADMNIVLLMGNVTRDIEVRYTSSGTAVGTLGLAMNRSFRTRSGEEREDVCFVDVDVFGQQAEACRNHLSKGSPVLVEGRLRLDQWQDKRSGENRSRLKVVAESVVFLARGGGGGGTPAESES
jgi:single-strand DNA-binding protein